MSFRVAALACVIAALAACSKAPSAGYPGYVEGEYVRVGAPLAGTLLKLAVERGAEVQRRPRALCLASGVDAPSRRDTCR